MSALKCRPPKHPLKDTCALSFFKGALLNDPKHILRTIGREQAGRWIKFTSLKEICGYPYAGNLKGKDARPNGGSAAAKAIQLRNQRRAVTAEPAGTKVRARPFNDSRIKNSGESKSKADLLKRKQVATKFKPNSKPPTERRAQTSRATVAACIYEGNSTAKSKPAG